MPPLLERFSVRVSSLHWCCCCSTLQRRSTLQSQRSDRKTQPHRPHRGSRWQPAHRALIPQLISHAQIRRAPVLSQLVFICSLPLWLFQPSLQSSGRADLQLFIGDFFFFGKGASEKTEHGGKGRQKTLLCCICFSAAATTLRGNNFAALEGDVFPF